MAIESKVNIGDRLGSVAEIDHNHPLYLHVSDGPGSLSIGIQLVGMENYMFWNHVIRITLLGRNKIGFVDSSITRETFGPFFGPYWDSCNAIVVSWLTGNISCELLSGILFRSNAFMEWSDLKE